MDNDSIKLIGVYNDNGEKYHLYYGHRFKQSFLLTPNMRVTRCFGHCNNYIVAKWAKNHLENYLNNRKE